MARSPHSQAVDRATNDMNKVIASFTDAPFMSDSVSPDTQRRQKLFESMAPDLKQMLASGMPQYMVERLARMDQES